MGSSTLTSAEVTLFRSRKIEILPIADETGACSYETSGSSQATDALTAAANLRLTKGSTIFLDIEPSNVPTSACISAYANAFSGKDYKPGFYENPAAADFGSASCSAATSNTALATVSLWTQQPNKPLTTEKNSPAFAPTGVSCSSGRTVVWQYATSGSVTASGYPSGDPYDESDLSPAARGVLSN